MTQMPLFASSDDASTKKLSRPTCFGLSIVFFSIGWYGLPPSLPLSLMLFGSSKKSSVDPASLAMQIVVSALLFLASLASLVGLVLSHVNVQRGTLTFGSSGGSLAILAFAVTVTLWSHTMTCLLSPDAPKKK